MRRVIGIDIHRTFGEVVIWENGVLRREGRVEMTRTALEGFGRRLDKTDEGWPLGPGDYRHDVGSIAALATTLALSAVVSATGIGFQRGTHTRWQLVSNDASGAPTLTDIGASFAIATGGVLTLVVAEDGVRRCRDAAGAAQAAQVHVDRAAARQRARLQADDPPFCPRRNLRSG
jgi:hypothetical protein